MILNLISFKQPYFKNTILFVVLIELLSLLGHFIPELNTVVFAVIILLTIIISLEKLEYGIYILLAELFIGSKGYLFFIEYNGVNVSIRLALFLVIISIGLFHFWKTKPSIQQLKDNLKTLSTLNKIYILFGIILLVGVINAIQNNHPYNNIFFDSNGYLYWLLYPIILFALKNKTQIENVLQIFFATLVTISTKTLILLFLFSHSSPYILHPIYRWIRITGVGEIANLQSGFYRIFMQNQIYLMLGFIIILYPLLKLLLNKTPRSENKNICVGFWMLILLGASLITSLSRSFWVGILLALVVLFVILGLKSKKEAWQSLCVCIVIIYSSIGLILTIINFPYPSKTYNTYTIIDTIQDRTIDTKEAAVMSRWNLLPVLWNKVVEKPALGFGFGSLVTYTATDPRVLAVNPTGEYTTYSFEWGYLDIMLKIGSIGLIIYLIFMFYIAKPLWSFTSLNFLLSLIALLTTHIFSPYLNHPLGIGYLIMLILIGKHFET